MNTAICVTSILAMALTSGQVADKPLRETYAEAKQLAKNPETNEQAIAKYTSLIETHLANEKLFQSALRELAQCYESSDRTEEGVRYLIGLGYKILELQRQQPLQQIFAGFQLKHPELVAKIARDMHGSDRAPRISSVPSDTLVKAIVQRADPQLRDKSLQKLQEMLADESSDADKRSALATLRQALTAKFDREPFWPLVWPLLESPDAEIRALTLQILPGVGATASNLDLVVPLADDESAKVRMNVTSTLIMLGKGDRAEIVIPALMKLLRDENEAVVERSIRSMWGQYYSPQFDELLIELSREQKYHHNVVYFCLSTMRSKSPAVCERLIEVLDEPDWNDSGRAAWGLTYGVTEEAKPLVEEGLLNALPEETNQGTRKNEFRALRRVATEKSRPYLQSVADSEMETDELRQLAREILNDLDSK